MPAIVRVAVAGLFFLCASPAFADEPWPGYRPQFMRENDDYSMLCDRPDTNILQSLKCVPFSGDGSDYVSFGGEYRFRIDNYEHNNFGIHAGSFTSGLNRVWLDADIHLGDDLRFFVQLGTGDEVGRKPFPRPGDTGQWDLAQGFADANFSVLESHWRLRVGRQEVSIGRYVALRDATNFRLTFDGIRLDGGAGDWSVIALAADSTLQQPGAFDDYPNHRDGLMLFVLSHPIPYARDFSIDVAALEHDKDGAIYEPGPGNERRRTVGLRFHGVSDGWDLDAQASYQFGTFETVARDLAISARGVAFEGGRSFADIAWSPRLALRIDMAGGTGKENGHTLGTFDLPYPNFTYLTDAGIFTPRNVKDIQPFLVMHPTPTFAATVGTQFLWRVSSQDELFSPADLPILKAGGIGSYVATQPYLRLSWQPIPIVTIQATFEEAFAAILLRNAGGRDEQFEFVSTTIDL